MPETRPLKVITQRESVLIVGLQLSRRADQFFQAGGGFCMI
jgi:hypothetical protein